MSRVGIRVPIIWDRSGKESLLGPSNVSTDEGASLSLDSTARAVSGCIGRTRGMLLTALIPLSDARPFTADAAPRLCVPCWPLPQPGRQFVRSFGCVQRRPRGGHEFWNDEAFFTSAHRAVRFDRLERQQLAPGFQPRCSFRRLFSDGTAVARLEIGISHRYALAPLSESDCSETITRFLNLPMRVMQACGEMVPTPLAKMGPSVAKLFHAASAPGGLGTESFDPLLVQAADPILLIEHGDTELAKLPRLAKPIASGVLHGLQVAFLWQRYEGRAVGVWFINTAHGDGAAIRRLRMGLLRLHAEYQTLKRVLLLIRTGQLKHRPGTPYGECLERYLNRATRLLFRRKRGGMNMQPVLECIQAYDEVAYPEERSLLSQALRDVRRQLRKKLERLLDLAPGTTPSAPPSPCPFRAYEGNDPFLFVSYAHKDAEAVYSVLSRLHQLGYRIWYDQGISPGTIWPRVLADAILKSAGVLAFISPQSVKSEHCLDEVSFAIESTKPLLPVYLGPTELPTELRLTIGRRQAVFRHLLNPEEFERQVLAWWPVPDGPVELPSVAGREDITHADGASL